MTLSYTDPAHVTDTRVTDVSNHGKSATGYGGKIPTRHMIEYAGRWRRVCMMAYGNGGTPYVLVKGETFVLDMDTEHRLKGN